MSREEHEQGHRLNDDSMGLVRASHLVEGFSVFLGVVSESRGKVGPAVSVPKTLAGSGSVVVDQLVSISKGLIERKWLPGGLCAHVRLPLTEQAR